MADPKAEGIDRTFSGDPHAPAKAPEARAVLPSPKAAGKGSAADMGEGDVATLAQPSAPPKTTYSVIEHEGGLTAYAATPDDAGVDMGAVDLPNAREILNASGAYYNKGTRSWENVPEEIAKSLTLNDAPVPTYIWAKYKQNKALIASSGHWMDYLAGKISIEEAEALGDAEGLQTLVKDAPLFAWQGSGVKTLSKMWEDLKEAGVGGALRRTAGEVAGQAAFMTEAPMLAATGMVLVAPLIATGGTAAPAVAAGLALALETGATGLAFRSAYRIEGGQAAREMRKKGFDEDAIKTYAPLVGVVNGTLEAATFRLIPAPYRRVLLSKVVASEAVKKALAKAYVNFALELGTEVTTEVAQERVNIFVEGMAADAEARPELKDSSEESLNRTVNAGLAAFIGVGGLKVPGAVLEAGVHQANVKAEAKATETPASAAATPQQENAASSSTSAPEFASPAVSDEKAAEFAGVVQEFDKGKVSSEELIAKTDAVLEETAPVETRGKLEQKTQEVETKARLEALTKEREAVAERIVGLEAEQTQLAAEKKPTGRISAKLGTLREIEQGIMADIKDIETRQPGSEILRSEPLSLKAATLEDLVNLGFKEGRKEVLGTRRQEVLKVAKTLELTQADLSPLLGQKNYGTMGDVEFKNWMESKFKPAAKEAFKRKLALREVRALQASKNIEQERNVRLQNKLPSVDKMDVKQLRDYVEILKTLDKGDKALTPKRARALETTKFSGARTMKEVASRVQELWGKPSDTLSRLLPEPSWRPDITRGMDRLAARSPMHKAAVQMVETATEAEDLAYMAEREKLYELGAKALASRKGVFARRFMPTMPEVMAHLEADDAQVYTGQVTLPALTKEEQALVEYIDSLMAEKLDYLVKVQGLKSRFAGKYFTHAKRGLVEIIDDIKDTGWRSALKEIYESWVPNPTDFSVISQGGKSVGLRAHMKQTMFRTGELKPTKNVIHAVDEYLKGFHKKKALDWAVPQVDTMVDAAVWMDTDKTPDGQARKAAFDKFIEQYLAQKKGQSILANVVPQGGLLDIIFRTAMSLPSWAWIAANPKLQGAAKIGEVMATVPVAGPIGLANAWRLRFTKEGAAYLKAYESFTGTPILKRFAEPGQTLDETAGLLMYGVLQMHRVHSMQDVLLALSTKEEIQSGKISPERLAEIKIQASRWMDVKGAKSVLGATSVGALVTQFKGWAIPILETTIEDHAALLKQLAGKEKMTELQKLELQRIYATGATVAAISWFMTNRLGVGVDEDGEPQDWVTQFLNAVHQELFSITGGANPFLVLALPPAARYYDRLLKAISLTTVGLWDRMWGREENRGEFKGGEHEGELKGPAELKRLLPGRALWRQVMPEDEE